MSRLLARIMLAVFMLPVGSIIYLIVFCVLYEDVLRRREEACFVVAGVVTALFVGVYWLLLWYRSVRWTRSRVACSVASVVGALAVGGLVAWLMSGVGREMGYFLFGPAATFVWLVLTIFVWRETAAERARRIDVRGLGALVCPACGYNLTGLRQATCPECGARYTMDELVASQPSRQADELEKPAA